MITRIEIDGFKSFVGFELDVPRFLVVVGPNGSGKSNLLDALELARRAAEEGPAAALLDGGRGNADELFHRRIDGTRAPQLSMRFDFSGDAGHEGSWEFRVERPAVATEPYRQLEAAPSQWKAEVGQLRVLSLEPNTMRERVSARDRGPLNRDGSNLAAVLGRLSENPDLFFELESYAGGVIPGLVRIDPTLDRRNEWEFDLRFRESTASAVTASDGTLRVLGILAAILDSAHPGLMAVDEAENGVHPERLSRFVDIIREVLATPALLLASRQILLTTHSPVVVSRLRQVPDCEVQFFGTAFRPYDDEQGERRTSYVTHPRTLRPGGERGTYVTPIEIDNFLSTVERAGLPCDT
jgi:predicted ATPase